MSYNSARLHRSKVLHAYPPLLPYILDGHQIMGRTVRLYLQLSYPGVVSPSDHNLYFEGGKEPKVWEPTLNRVGLVWLTLEGKNKLLRIIHLQSYTFYSLSPNRDPERRQQRSFPPLSPGTRQAR